MLRADHDAISPSTAARTHGMSAQLHERFGIEHVESIGPDAAKTMAPSAAAVGVSRRRKNTNIPAAATGIGRATMRLKPMIVGRNRSGSVNGKNVWSAGSSTVEYPPPRYGFQIGIWPSAIVRRNHSWCGRNQFVRSRT